MNTQIQAQWLAWNYAGDYKERGYWIPEGPPATLHTRETEKSYIVLYGNGDIRKILPKRNRFGDRVREKWSLIYGSHNRLTRTRIIFTIKGHGKESLNANASDRSNTV